MGMLDLVCRVSIIDWTMQLNVYIEWGIRRGKLPLKSIPLISLKDASFCTLSSVCQGICISPIPLYVYLKLTFKGCSLYYYYSNYIEQVSFTTPFTASINIIPTPIISFP
jgi:hypothetical protein